MKGSGNANGIERLVVTVQELSLARDIDTVMKIVRKAGRELTGADGATFILREGDSCFYADEEAISPLWKGHRFPMANCISGWAMLNRRAAVIEDIYADGRIPFEAYRHTFVKSLAMVPIRTIDPIGAIGNYWGKLHLPTPEEVNLLQALADVTAVTLENIKVHAELEQRVKDRTAELEKVNKELEAFSYSVSHDLRAPLRSIKGYINILLENYGDKFDEDGILFTNKIIGNVTGMEQLIHDLLTFFGMGRKDVLKSKVSMKNTVTGIWRECCEENGNIDIEFSLGELPEAHADGALIRQVWINLISNAIKYTRRVKKAVIKIDYEEKEDSIVYFIKDNGAGFDMKYYDKLFGVFQRLHTREEFEGTGIGLAIVERIILKHGGRVWAEGELNQGATFYFLLPKQRPL